MIMLLCAARAADVRAEADAPFWNGHAKQFISPPALAFKPVDGAASYRFTLTPETGGAFSFEADDPRASLAPIWSKLPVGTVQLKVEALGQSGGAAIGVVGERRFHRAAEFDAARVGKPVVSYAQSARVALDSVVHEPFVQSWRTTGQPDPKYALYRYSSKIIGSLMSGCAMYASRWPRPGDADDVLAVATRAAYFLTSVSAAPGTPLEYFPPTYHGAKPTERENDAFTMLMTPAEAGQGYLDLYDVTRDERHLQAARRIARTYAKLQRPDGTWHLKVDNRTGEPIAPVELIPSVVISFLDRLIAQHGETELQPTVDRALSWMMQNPVRTSDWKAQFDDAKVRGPYENLSKHEATEFASYLFRTAKGDVAKIAIAENILDWAEDQFVIWDHPPDLNPRNDKLKAENWFTPCSAEQYAMFEPISGSSAFMIVAYIRAYDATGKQIYLAKADALANALTVAQQHHHGRYPTRMIKEDLSYWINSTINTARAMNVLGECHERRPR